MRRLKERFKKNPEVERPPFSWRRPLAEIPKMGNHDFEQFYVSAINKANLLFPVTEESMTRLAAVIHNVFRIDNNVVLTTGKNRKHYPTLWSAFLNRLWSDDLTFFWRMSEPHHLMWNYIGEGGRGVLVENYSDEAKALSFLERPDIAVEHLRQFKGFLNSIPSKNIDFQRFDFPNFKNFDFSEVKIQIKEYMNNLSQHVYSRFQSHMAGIPYLNFRHVGDSKIRNSRKEIPVVITRIFPWDSDIVGKMETAAKRGISTAKPISLVTIDSADFLIMTNDGKALSYVGRDSKKSFIHSLFKKHGELLARAHSVGVGHDDPAPRNVVFKQSDTRLSLTLIDYEDLWIADKEEPIPYPDRKLGLTRVVEETNYGHLPYGCLDAFIEGYGKDEFQKVMGRTY